MDFREQMNKVLDEFSETAMKAADNATAKAVRAAAKELKKTSPSGRRRKYAGGWRAKITKTRLGSEGVAYNAVAPGLTHLLEKGTGRRHTRRGHYRGVMPANPHIFDAQENAEKKWTEVFEGGLK